MPDTVYVSQVQSRPARASSGSIRNLEGLPACLSVAEYRISSCTAWVSLRIEPRRVVSFKRRLRLGFQASLATICLRQGLQRPCEQAARQPQVPVMLRYAESRPSRPGNIIDCHEIQHNSTENGHFLERSHLPFECTTDSRDVSHDMLCKACLARASSGELPERHETLSHLPPGPDPYCPCL